MHFRISQQIFIALAIIALVLSLFFCFTLDRFNRYFDRFEQVARYEMPDLVIAAELEQESAQLVALTQDILLPSERYLFADVKDLIKQSVKRALNLIDGLDCHNGNTGDADLLALKYR
ncbi:MAG: hypothetical protein D3924_14110, partial [Candidatus Electrothrix sp. AR4]|nr:hypothetical protein [Candidatus Electrothrix sp. AR4]